MHESQPNLNCFSESLPYLLISESRLGCQVFHLGGGEVPLRTEALDQGVHLVVGERCAELPSAEGCVPSLGGGGGFGCGHRGAGSWVVWVLIFHGCEVLRLLQNRGKIVACVGATNFRVIIQFLLYPGSWVCLGEALFSATR